MPYLVSFTCWPSDKTDEVLKKAIEVLQKYPPDPSLGEPVVPNAAKATLNGIKTIGITEVKEGKLEESLARARAILNMYAIRVAGFEYSIEVWSNVEEAYASIGQKPPE